MIESWTGTVVDVTLIEKCMNKKCRKALFSLQKCPDGKFHGGSKSLEVSAVLELYKQSDTPDFPLRYTTYVGDGDANVHNNIVSHTPRFYNGEFVIEKEECVYHYRKRCKVHLTALFKHIRVSVVKKGVRRAHEEKNKKDKTDLPLDYSKLKPKDFLSKNPWVKHIDTYPVRFANFIFFTLKAAVIKMEHSRTPEALLYMQNTIRSIPRHKMDHPGASCAQRKKYHAYCRPEFCEFAALPTEELKLAYTTNIVGEFWYEEKTKKGRPSTKAMDQILAKFDEFSTIAVMNRLTRWLNQNCNESIHH